MGRGGGGDGGSGREGEEVAALVLVAHLARRPHRGLAQLAAQLRVDAGRGRLLEHLLVAPLH